MQSRRALSFHLDELHLLGGELSLDSRLVGVSDELTALADSSPDRSPQRRDEPYRRAISGIYARLAATGWTLDRIEAPRSAVGEAPPYADAVELAADLDIIDRSLSAHGLAALALGRLPGLRRAVDAFAFHMPFIALRLN